jgi:hypothetical protein
MDHEEQQSAAANLSAMQRTARERLDAGTFSQYPARPVTDEQGDNE